jgi:hypothetical protein
MHSVGRLFVSGLNRMRCGVATTLLPGIMGCNRRRSVRSDNCIARIGKHTLADPLRVGEAPACDNSLYASKSANSAGLLFVR